MEDPRPALSHLHPACPILRVSDLSASVEYYVNVLGFHINWNYEHLIASVSRNDCCIFLSEGDQGHPGSWVWISVDDAGALYEEYRSKGAIIRHPPQNYDWAYEMQVADPDGNVLRLGSERLPDEPVGTWRDMDGDVWQRNADGRWTRVGADARDSTSA